MESKLATSNASASLRCLAAMERAGQQGQESEPDVTASASLRYLIAMELAGHLESGASNLA